MKILKENKNPLLSRKSLVLEEEHFASKSPSNEETTKKIAELLKTKPELVRVKHIYTKYGEGKSKIVANVYDTVEKLKEVEEFNKKKPKVKKEKPKEEPKKEEVKEEKKEDAKETKTEEQKTK